MLNNLQQLEPLDFRGHIFIGTVVANNDPLKIERIKVSIPNMFEGADLELYPWAARKDGGPIATGQSHGSFGLVPRVGDKVFVEFQHGNSLYPLYWKAPILVGWRPAEANVNYPNRYGHKDPAGNIFIVDTTPGSTTIEVTHKSGTSFRINDDGSITLTAVAAINSSAPVWNHAGNIIVDGDVIASNISLVNHVHGGIDPGPANTSPPVG